MDQETNKEEAVSSLSPVEQTTETPELTIVQTEVTNIPGFQDSIFETPRLPRAYSLEYVGSLSLVEIAGVLVSVGYIFFWLSLTALPFLDLPNHLARAKIIGELLTDASSTYHQQYSFTPEFVPYLLGDLLLTALTLIFKTQTAGAMWAAISFIAIPISFLLFARTRGLSGVGLTTIGMLSLYLSGDWFFLSGFLNYRFGIAVTFLTLAAWEMLISSKGRKQTINYFLAYCFACVACYLTHLAPFLFLGLLIGATTSYRVVLSKLKISKALAGFVPLICLSIVHLSGMHASESARQGSDPFRTVFGKIQAIGMPYIKFSFVIDAILFAGFIGVTTLIIWNGRKSNNRGSLKENLFILGVLSASFVVLPAEWGSIYDVDNRALPFVFLFLLIAVGDFSKGAKVPLNILLLAVLFNVANLFYLNYNLAPLNEKHRLYNEAVSQIPLNKSALPINTWPDYGRVETGLHAGSFYTSDSNGLTPYIFGGDKSDAMSYFRYLRRPYAPDPFWYTRNRTAPDWERVVSDYDYLIVTAPFDRSRLKLTGMKEIYSNSAATIFVTK